MSTQDHASRPEHPLLAYVVYVRNYLVVPGLLALATLFMIRIYPPAPVAIGLAICCALVYLYRREWIVEALFVGLLFQNLVHNYFLNHSETLARLVKSVDDVLLVGFVVALTFEAVFPVLRPERLPLWKSFAALVLVCLLSAASNRLPVRFAAVGMYVLLKNFVWFYLAASLPLREADYRRIFRFLILVLGGVMAFGFLQIASGDLTYRLLNLPRDYRFGILRVRSIFVHPVFLAETMSLLAILSISAHVHLRKGIYLWLGIAALLMTALTMMAKTILAVGAASGLFLAWKKRWLVAPYAIAVSAGLVFFSEYGLENFRRQYRMYIESPASVRRESFRIAGEIALDSPLLGVGPGGFGGFAATILDSPVPTQYGFVNYDGLIYSTFDTHWPHLLAEIGLLGFLAYGWFLWAAARNALRLAHRSRGTPYFRVLAIAAAAFLFVVILEAFAATNLEDTMCGFLVFTMLGLAQRPPAGSALSGQEPEVSRTAP